VLFDACINWCLYCCWSYLKWHAFNCHQSYIWGGKRDDNWCLWRLPRQLPLIRCPRITRNVRRVIDKTKCHILCLYFLYKIQITNTNTNIDRYKSDINEWATQTELAFRSVYWVCAASWVILLPLVFQVLLVACCLSACLPAAAGCWCCWWRSSNHTSNHSVLAELWTVSIGNASGLNAYSTANSDFTNLLTIEISFFKGIQGLTLGVRLKSLLFWVSSLSRLCLFCVLSIYWQCARSIKKIIQEKFP